MSFWQSKMARENREKIIDNENRSGHNEKKFEMRFECEKQNQAFWTIRIIEETNGNNATNKREKVVVKNLQDNLIVMINESLFLLY